MSDPCNEVTYGACRARAAGNCQPVTCLEGTKCRYCADLLYRDGTREHWNARQIREQSDRLSPLPAKVTVHAGGRVTLEALRDAERERDHAEHRVEVMHRHYVEMMRQRDELRARTEQGGDIHALITDGHHMERLLTNALPILLHLDPNDLQDGAPFMDDEQLTDMVGAIRSGLYEWDKRARRSKVDWWNR